ncbi:hypothetical protein C8J57DRAFT_1358184, partial [Mycena rebaudengoi]
PTAMSPLDSDIPQNNTYPHSLDLTAGGKSGCVLASSGHPHRMRILGKAANGDRYSADNTAHESRPRDYRVLTHRRERTRADRTAPGEYATSVSADPEGAGIRRWYFEGGLVSLVVCARRSNLDFSALCLEAGTSSRSLSDVRRVRDASINRHPSSAYRSLQVLVSMRLRLHLDHALAPPPPPPPNLTFNP